MPFFHNLGQEAAYFDWLEKNPAGFVLNCWPPPDGGTVVLHRSSCPSLRKPERYVHVNPSYPKFCALSEAEIDAWVKRNRKDSPRKNCGKCW